MKAGLKEYLIELGATVVGIAEVDEALEGDIAHLRRAISIGVDRKLNEDTVSLLSNLQNSAAMKLKSGGYRYLIIPPDSDRITDTYISKLYKLFSHKVAATCSGLGWIGRNGLLINEKYGPGLSFTTVLTDAPLVHDEPQDSSRCGECMLCVEHCPAQAISGATWSRSEPLVSLIDHDRCRAQKSVTRRAEHKPNCGLCINICPYGRKSADRDSINNDLEEHDVQV
jgi:NAD-dependent dihydropyrimidine dehydrogenase PreA subunit